MTYEEVIRDVNDNTHPIHIKASRVIEIDNILKSGKKMPLYEASALFSERKLLITSIRAAGFDVS